MPGSTLHSFIICIMSHTRLLLATLATGFSMALGACSSTNTGAGIDASAPPPPPPELGVGRNQPERTVPFGGTRRDETAQAGLDLSF